jgi:hypothetical protein
MTAFNGGGEGALKTKGLSCLWTFQPGRRGARNSPVPAISAQKRTLRLIDCGPEISNALGPGVGKVHA